MSLGLVMGGVGIVGLLAAVATDRLARSLLRPHVRPLERTPHSRDVPFQEVEFTSTGGVTLRGWLLGEPALHGRGTPVVLTHGWTGNSGELLPLAIEIARTRTPVLLFDVRGHGRSDPAAAVTARHFRDDLLAAVDLVRREVFGGEVLLVGHSMGGAASVLTAVSTEGVGGLVLLGTPADLLEVTEGYLNDRGLPGSLIVRLCLPSWRIRAGEPLASLNPQERIGEVSAPLAVVHGSQDGRVPLAHARRLAEAGGGRLRIVEGGGHSDLVHRQEVVDEVVQMLEFMERTDPIAGGSR